MAASDSQSVTTHVLKVHYRPQLKALKGRLQACVALEHVLQGDEALQDLVLVTDGNEELATILNKDLLKLCPQFVLAQELVLSGARLDGAILKHPGFVVAIGDEKPCTFEVNMAHHGHRDVHRHIVQVLSVDDVLLVELHLPASATYGAARGVPREHDDVVPAQLAVLVEGNELDALEGLLHVVERVQVEVRQLLSLDEVLVHRQGCHLACRRSTHDLEGVEFALFLEVGQGAYRGERGVRQE